MESLFVIVILIFSVIIHEISHGYAALALGDPTAKYEGRLSLNPFRHLDPFGSILIPLLGYLTGGIIIGWAKPVPYNPYNLRNQRWGEALVAVAGPISNITIAVIFSFILRSGFEFSDKFLYLAGYIVFINIILSIFNLVPIPPLDGSKILFSFFPNKLQGLRNAVERFGFILVLLFVFLFWQFLFPITASITEFLVGSAVI